MHVCVCGGYVCVHICVHVHVWQKISFCFVSMLIGNYLVEESLELTSILSGVLRDSFPKCRSRKNRVQTSLP